VNSLVLSGNETVAALSAHGAFASRDSGATWKTCGQPAPSAVWYGLAFDSGGTHGANGATTALAATSTGLFRSADGCLSWVKATEPLNSAGGNSSEGSTVNLVLFHPAHAGEAFAAEGGMVYRSTDQGQHWQPMDDEGRGFSWPSSLFILPEYPDRLFALFPRRGVLSNRVDEETPLPGNPLAVRSSR